MKEDRAIMFLMTDTPHLPYLVVSMESLTFDLVTEPVIVYAFPQSFEIVKQMSKDFAFEPRLWNPTYTRKNSQEVEKIKVVQSLKEEYRQVLYLDADILVNSSLDWLWRSCEMQSFVGTQFCDWIMKYSIPRKRVLRLLDIEGIPKPYVWESLDGERPALNSGIFCTTTDNPILPVWGDWTYKSRKVYISGECALHPAICKFEKQGLATILEGGAYNCSTMRFQPDNLKDEDVVIWHFHGDSNVKINGDGSFKSKKGFDIWWPKYRSAVDRNLGGVAEWAASCGNRHLDRLEKEYVGRQD